MRRHDKDGAPSPSPSPSPTSCDDATTTVRPPSPCDDNCDDTPSLPVRLQTRTRLTPCDDATTTTAFPPIRLQTRTRLVGRHNGDSIPSPFPYECYTPSPLPSPTSRADDVTTTVRPPLATITARHPLPFTYIPSHSPTNRNTTHAARRHSLALALAHLTR